MTTSNQPTAQHVPVMLNEALEWLDVKPGKWYVDGTFGRGGHTKAILAAGGKVIAFDWDHEAIAHAERSLAATLKAGHLKLIHASFEKLHAEVTAAGLETSIAGVLFDFGTSSDQLTNSERGFSFHDQGELDMRMDQRLGVKAKDLLAVLSEAQLGQIFFEYGGDKEGYRIARAIVNQRRLGTYISTTTALAELVQKVKRQARTHLHPATKVFQALRIAVNGELTAISTALPQALELLQQGPGGRLVTIAFHEGEDRLVKAAMAAWDKAGSGRVLTKHPITPGEEELNTNNKARSAKLRVFETTTK